MVVSICFFLLILFLESFKIRLVEFIHLYNSFKSSRGKNLLSSCSSVDCPAPHSSFAFSSKPRMQKLMGETLGSDGYFSLNQ